MLAASQPVLAVKVAMEAAVVSMIKQNAPAAGNAEVEIASATTPNATAQIARPVWAGFVNQAAMRISANTAPMVSVNPSVIPDSVKYAWAGLVNQAAMRMKFVRKAFVRRFVKMIRTAMRASARSAVIIYASRLALRKPFV